MEAGDSRRKASSKPNSPQPNLHFQGRSACGSSFNPRRGQPSLPQGRAQLRSMQPAKSGPHRTDSARPARPQQPLDPRQRGWAWAPAATAPPTRAREERVRPTRHASPRPTCRGERVSWTAATGLRAGAQVAGARPRDLKYPWWDRAGRDWGAAAGQRGPSRGSRGPGSPLSTSPPPPPPFCLPLGVAAAALRRRFPGCRHFPASLARGPRTGGFCPPGCQRPARRLWPPAFRWSPSPQRVGERRPASPPPGAARVTCPGSWDQALPLPSPLISVSLFF